MWISARCWSLFLLVVLATVYLWRTTPNLSWISTRVLARASFEVGLALPAYSPRTSQRVVVNRTSRTKYVSNRGIGTRHRRPISRYMLRLYHRRPDADIVRALQPAHVSRPLANGGGRILEFTIPPTRTNEILEAAELLGTAGLILRVRSVDDSPWRSPQRARRDDYWRAFNVTSAVFGRKSDLVRLCVRGRIEDGHRGEGPILLLSYSKPKRRKRRSLADEDQENVVTPWKSDTGRRHRRNPCRKRSLYVDFATISYDEWVVAPKGYDAYQCVGKCLYPLGDHLSPTKHAIVQTLVYTALQASNDISGKDKPTSRACCVPTRLTATSLLYMDSGGTLTYQYGYEDMVVAECGCR